VAIDSDGLNDRPLHHHRPTPSWYDDAKLGIFVHWTAAAVPAFAPVGPSPFELAATEGEHAAFASTPYVEWYQNSLAIAGSPVAEHHAEHYGTASFDDFVAEFLAGVDGWEAGPWADLFARAGARYVVLVTKHHDGVCLWPTTTPNPHKPGWHSERDLVGELASEVRAAGMRFGTYYSGGLDWTFGGTPIDSWRSLIAAIPQSPEYLAYADSHWRELIERYDPALLWNDIGYPASADLDDLFAHYYAAVPDGVVNNRFDFIRQTRGEVHCDIVTPEYSTDGTPDRKFEVCRGIGTSFGYNREEPDDSYLDPDDLIRMFVDIVARGGNLLLNVGPTATGEIPAAQSRRLLALGWWLEVHGEAIYDTRPWSTAAATSPDGTEVRFTCRPDTATVYALVLDPRPTRTVVVPSIDPATVHTVRRLGYQADLPWASDPVGGGIVVTLPEPPAATPALALAVTQR
jgi:alpha-L-fucosidase